MNNLCLFLARRVSLKPVWGGSAGNSDTDADFKDHWRDPRQKEASQPALPDFVEFWISGF